MIDGDRPQDQDRPELATPKRPIRAMTFIVRMSESETGAVGGVVEQPSTGRKERFHGAATIGQVIAGMMGAVSERTEPDDRAGR